MHKFLTIFLAAAGLLATSAASAQDFGNSPYSRLGLGDVNTSNGSIRSFGMGNTGVAAPNSNLLNLQNPALLYFNNNVIFELSVASQLKTLKEGDKSQRDGSGFNELVINKETVHRGFMFKSGMSYRHKVGAKKNLAIGGVYTLSSKLNADQRLMTQRPTTAGQETMHADSILDRKVTLPSGFQVGLSFDNGSNWSVNADVEGQQGSQFRTAEGNQEYVNSMRVGFGGEYVPEPASPKYLRRVTYRAGFTTGKTPYNINGTQLNETAVTWGFTFPLGRAMVTESYYLNMGFALGKRGTTEKQLVQENFIRIQAGLSLNNRWFIKRQLD